MQDPSRIWQAAFPTALSSTVARVVADIPPATLEVSGTIDSDLNPRGIRVNGEKVVIPYRQYATPRAPSRSRRSSAEDLVLACMYSRHHDGHVRQNSLMMLLGHPTAWVAPYVVQLAGEYIIDIVTQIEYVTRRPDSG